MVEPADIRRMTPAVESYAYFQTSGFSPKPEPVIAEVIRWLTFQNQGPAVGWISQKVAEMFEETRLKVAQAIQADRDEIMLCENATVGINVIAHGFDWRPGDNVLLSSHEHPGNRITWYNLATRYGVELRYLLSRTMRSSTFHIPGLGAAEVSASLLEHERVLISTLEAGSESLRVSTHVFNTGEEIDRLIGGLHRIQRQGY